MENKSDTCHMTNENWLIDVSPVIRDLTAMKSVYDAIALDGIIKALKEAPTVDAVEVVHGRWLANGICSHKPSRFRNPDKWTIYKCSECGYSNGRRKNANYCPNCGAKMDGGNVDG